MSDEDISVVAGVQPAPSKTAEVSATGADDVVEATDVTVVGSNDAAPDNNLHTIVEQSKSEGTFYFTHFVRSV